MWMSITTTMGRCIFMAAITRAQRLRHQVAAEPLLQLHLFSGRPGERRPVRAGRRPRRARCSSQPDLVGHDRLMLNTLGLQLRRDRVDPVALYSTVARERLSTTRARWLHHREAAT